MAVTKIKPIKSTLSKALDYIQNPDKTDGKTLVSSFGCSYETADIEFEYTLSQARQKGNNLAFHLIQSFEPGEVDCEKAHASFAKLANRFPIFNLCVVFTNALKFNRRCLLNCHGRITSAFRRSIICFRLNSAI